MSEENDNRKFLQVVVSVGSKNPVKVKSVSRGVSQALTSQAQLTNSELDLKIFPYDVASGVPDQPMSDDETRLGAINRAKAAFQCHVLNEHSEPSYSIGLEGGVQMKDDNMECFAWMAVYDGKRIGTARTSSFNLPAKIRDLVLSGIELGDADDQVFGTLNSKQAGGTVGHLTRGVVDRTAYYEQAVVLAMIPFLWDDLYKDI